ncbi:MAG TPA: radical SAM protein [Clostridia bacterium]|nr:radical SAM protein [Clostridia bacterium]
MRKVPFLDSARIIARGSRNWPSNRPIVVSFEVTDSCTCFCRHCDHGGPRDESKNLKPADYRRYMEVLNPCVVQVSGGEPLMREDVVDVVRAIKGGSNLPYIILLSNWSHMTEEKYLALCDAGVDQFNVSLDFPDERHDGFRGYPGLYERMCDLVPRLAKHGHDNIVLNSCIHSENLPEINRLADKAKEWGVNICYSSYTSRRTGCKELSPTPEQLPILNREFDRIEQRRDSTNWIVSAKSTIDATREFFTNGAMPGCRAGHRFLVVTSDGWLQPCSMVFKKFKLEDHWKMVEEFTNTNTCDQCYVAIRSNLDKTFPQILRENVRGYLSLGGARP